MAIFARNFIFKIPQELSLLALKIPRAKITAIRCLKSRDFNSSVPVRYTSKKHSRIVEPKCSPPAEGSRKDDMPTRKGAETSGVRIDVFPCRRSAQPSIVVNENSQNQIQNRMPTNVELFHGPERDFELTDKDCGFLEYELMGEHEELGEESEIDNKEDSKRNLSNDVKTTQDVEKLAIELLAKRAYTTAELRKKVQGMRFHLGIIDAVILDFQSRGLINDGLYAENFSQSRWSSSCWGPRRVKHALLKKGINEVEAEKAIKVVFEGSGIGTDQKSKLGLSEALIDRLIDQASKQWLRGGDVPRETRKQRMVRWLQYRGFKWDVVNFVIKKLESQHSS